jgi:hypothetical protein
MDRCPNCRARLDGSEHCRRCGLELRLLLAADRAGAAAIERAIRRLAEGDRAAAIRDLEQARSLSGDTLAAALLAFARAQPDPVSDPAPGPAPDPLPGSTAAPDSLNAADSESTDIGPPSDQDLRSAGAPE